MNNSLNLDLIRAWKDEDFREGLNLEQQAQLLENPAGMVELTDEELGSADGGTNVSALFSAFESFLLSYWITRAVLK